MQRRPYVRAGGNSSQDAFFFCKASSHGESIVVCHLNALDNLLTSADVAARCRDYAGRIRASRPLDEACRLIEELVGTDVPRGAGL